LAPAPAIQNCLGSGSTIPALMLAECQTLLLQVSIFIVWQKFITHVEP